MKYPFSLHHSIDPEAEASQSTVLLIASFVLDVGRVCTMRRRRLLSRSRALSFVLLLLAFSSLARLGAFRGLTSEALGGSVVVRNATTGRVESLSFVRNSTALSEIASETKPPVQQQPVQVPIEHAHATASVPRIVLVSYVFGKPAAQKHYLELFCESARYSGVDVVLLGDNTPSFRLPPNVQHVLLSWDNLVDRVRDKVFNGTEPGTLRQTSNYYKAIDFKPLVAHLFPTVVEAYDWWGHVDNDMILGDLRHFLTGPRLAKNHVIAGRRSVCTLGPLTLYRNTPVLNRLFQYAPSLEYVFATNETRVFDEWGGGMDPDPSNFEHSMSGILAKHKKELRLKCNSVLAGTWDGFCNGRKEHESPCMQCRWKRDPVNAKQILEARPANCSSPDNVNSRSCRWRSTVYCHFEYGKTIVEASLGDLANRLALLNATDVGLNFTGGLYPYVLP